MKARQLAICDGDNGYLKMLQAYLQKKNPADFEILIFDTVEKAIRASGECPFEILLVGEKIYDTNIVKIHAGKICILLEDGQKEIGGYSCVAKYQSMEKLIAQVLEELSMDDSCSRPGMRGRNRTSLVSIYSPVRHAGQSAAAFAMAQVLGGRGNKVLYLNLMPFSGFEELLRTEYGADVTDFMYFALKHSDRLLYKLDSLKCSVRGVDYLPPALDYADLLQISGEDWVRVIDLLLYGSDYTHIVVDLSETCQGFYHILGQSSKIFILKDSSCVYSRAMLSHYRKLLEVKEYDAILGRCVEFELPRQWEAQGAELGNIASSPVGVWMEEVLGQL